MKIYDFGNWTRVFYWGEPYMKHFIGHRSFLWGLQSDGFNVRGYIHLTNGSKIFEIGHTGFIISEIVGTSVVNPRAIK